MENDTCTRKEAAIESRLTKIGGGQHSDNFGAGKPRLPDNDSSGRYHGRGQTSSFAPSKVRHRTGSLRPTSGNRPVRPVRPARNIPDNVLSFHLQRSARPRFSPID